MKNFVKKDIKDYNSLVKKAEKGKIHLSPESILSYKKKVKNCERILHLLEVNKMTPSEFKKLSNNDRWHVAYLLKNVEWSCEKCGSSQGKSMPERMFFPGDAICCNDCDGVLTQRTGGGQNDSFNYTFKRLKTKKK